MKNRWVRLAVTLLLVGAMVWAGRKLFGEIDRLANASPLLVAAMLVVYVLTRIVDGDILRVALGALGYRIRQGEAFLLAMILTYTNLLVPRVGMGAPAVYLKHRVGVPYAQFGALMIPTVIIQLMAAGLWGLACQWALLRTTNVGLHGGVLTPLVLAVAGSAVLFLPWRLPARWQGRAASFTRRLLESWAVLMANRRVALRIFVGQLGICFLCGVRLYLAFVAIGQDVSFLGAFLMSMLAQLTILIGITPGAIGMREAAIVLAAPYAGTTREIALAAAALDRAVWMVVVVLVGQYGVWRLLRRRDVPQPAKG